MKYSIPIYGLLFLAMMASCEEEDTCLYTEKVVDYYIEIATNFEYGSKDVPINKWIKNVAIYIRGHPNQEDKDEIKKVINELNGLQNQVFLSIVENADQANVMLIVDDTTSFKEEFFWLGSNGQFEYWTEGPGSPFEITNGVVWFNSEIEDQNRRNWLIRHELTQVLGLPNDIRDYKDFRYSIFNEFWSGDNTEFSYEDKLLIQMHYSNVVRPGMTSDEIRNLTCWR